MSNSRPSKLSKSRSQSKQTKNDAPNMFGTPDNNNNVRKSPSVAVLSLLDKIDLDKLRQTSFSTMKPSLGSSSRDLYIDYALDMVINNLILNGHLDPTKAPQMRTPVMKSQIASICDKLVLEKSSKSSNAKCPVSKKCSTISRSKSKIQKWAVQPASLPITIITDHPPLQSQFSYMDEALKKAVCSLSTGSSSENSKKRKMVYKKSKSLSTTNKTKSSASAIPSERAANNKNVYQASSEVPSSNHSMEQNLQNLSNNCLADGNEQKQPRNVQFKGSNEDQQETTEVPLNSAAQDTSNSNIDKTVLTPLFQSSPSGNRTRTAVLASCPSTAKAVNATANSSNSSIASRYSVLIDMKGFNNDEISMEVEGRQLIFLAARSKRDGLNLRKVTEILDVPSGVVMENLKIGRRVDGYVIVEEHDLE